MNLLYKEYALAAHPTLYIFMLLGCLVIVPSYPYSVIFMFGCLAPFITFLFSRENNDAWYTAILPVRKREVVRAKCLLIASAQLGQLLISVPFAVLRSTLHIPNNPVGMDPNLAWYGCGLLVFAVFDMIFFPAYYQSGYKAGKSFLLAMLPVIPAMLVIEGVVHFPGCAYLDSTAPAALLRQAPILPFGLLCYAGGMLLAYRIAAKRFEKVDL